MPGFLSPSFLDRLAKKVNFAALLVWGGITGTLSDQTDLQDALDAKASILQAQFDFVALAPGSKALKVFGSNLPTGDNDLYTVPASKRAIIYGNVGYNPSAGTITWFPQVKISGTYYKIGASSNLSTGAGTGANFAVSSVVPYILEVGEIFSINTTTTAGLNIWFRAIEFSDTYPLSSKKIVALANGDNTLYTCANAQGAILPVVVNSAGAQVAAQIYVMNSSGATRTYIAYLVPVAGSAGSTNQLIPATAVNNGVLSTLLACNSHLDNGDFIVLNTNSGTAGQFAWINIFEP